MNRTATTGVLQTALVHHRAGRLADAEKFYAKARAAMPGSFDAYHLSGYLALQQRRHNDASVLLARASMLNPRSAICWLRLAHALKAQGRQSEACEAAGRAAALEPANADAHFCLGELAAVTEGVGASVPHFRRVTELQPKAADGWANLGVALTQSGQVDEALVCFERALAIAPENGQALSGRALTLQQMHRPSAAVEAYADILHRDPRNHEARSARLLALHYLDDVSAATLSAEHRIFGEVVAEELRAQGSRASELRHDRSPERKLRLGFLSPDLRAHSVAYFLEPLLAYLDREAFEVFLYHDHPRIDAVSERLRALSGNWRHVVGWPANRLGQTIRDDAIDVMVDLAGHTGFNRLPLFARRLAPVQVTYLGYPDTTGLAEMDYRFTDEIADPVGVTDSLHAERLVRFAPTAWLYAPPINTPEPACDQISGRVFTFGCFNNFSKVSPATLRLWAQVLAAVPDSRLLLKSRGLEVASEQKRIWEWFARCGIAQERVELLGRVSGMDVHLGTYARVDAALDTFPYHGTTTTCEALWMGVPVITLAGDRHMSRVGASLLQAVGRSEWIAHTPDDYVRIAVILAAAGPRGTSERHVLRDEMSQSVLMDCVGQAARFGQALRECWQSWCAQAGGKG